MENVIGFFRKVFYVEFVLFWILIAIAAIKGFFVALSNGGSFMDAITIGAFGFSLIPVFIITFCFFFMAFTPKALQLVFMSFFMPIPLYLLAFMSIPLAGQLPKPEFTSMSRVEQVSEVEKSVLTMIEGARKNPTGPEARLMRDWENANDGKPYESQIEEYRKEREAAIAEEKKNYENSSLGYKILMKVIK